MVEGLFQTRKRAVIKILRSQVARRYSDAVFRSIHGTQGFGERPRGRLERHKGQLLVEGEMDREQGATVIDCPAVEFDAAPECYTVRGLIDAIDEGQQPPIGVVCAANTAAPGICAHEAAMKGGVWLDAPLYNL